MDIWVITERSAEVFQKKNYLKEIVYLCGNKDSLRASSVTMIW